MNEQKTSWLSYLWGPSVRTFSISLLCIVFAFMVAALLIFMVGSNPWQVFLVFVDNSLFSIDGFGYSLFYTTPLLFTSLSVAFAFRCGLFNIGAEGQLYIGSIATAIAAVYLGGLPSWILIPILISVAFIAGGLWGAIPGYLKVRFGAHEVINTIMLNLIAYGICNYLVLRPFRRQGDQMLETEFIGQNARLFRLQEFFPFFDNNIPLNGAFFLGILLLVVYWLFFKYSVWGYEIKVVGSSPKVAEYAGIPAKKYVVLSMFIAGGLSGLVATHEVLGFRYTYHDNFSNGVGFMGIAIALLGRKHPLGIFLAACLFGMLTRGSLFLDLNFQNLSNDLVIVLQGVIIMFVGTHSIFEKILPRARA